VDDRVQKALDHANYRVTLHRQREMMKVRLTEELLYASNGGIFTVTSQLCTFVDLLIRKGRSETTLIDDKGNPIQIVDLPAFLDDIVDAYHAATNTYRVGWENLSKSRSVKALTGSV
jgi:hypothetical protein